MIRAGVALACIVVVIVGCGGGSDGGSEPTPTSRALEGPPMLINQPRKRSEVTVPFSISGAARLDGGHVVVQVVDAEGDVLCERAVGTSGAGGSSANWSTRMAFALPDGSVPLPGRIRAFSSVTGDGPDGLVVENEITIAPERPRIEITSPACGGVIASGDALMIEGFARTIDGTITVELRDGDNQVALTDEIAPPDNDGPWSAEVAISAVPGAYDLVAIVDGLSGAAPEEFAIPVLVTQ